MTSRRIAASFSTTGASSSQYHHYTAPKSRSETFVDYMKSTGYKPPKYFNSNHCDFLFQNTELFDMAKFLMGRAKHSVPEDDMDRYQGLLSVGKILSKGDLETAVLESEERHSHIATERDQLQNQSREIAEDISRRTSRMKQWSATKEFHRQSKKLRGSEKSKEEYEEENYKRKLKYLEDEIRAQSGIFEQGLTTTLSNLFHTLSLYRRTEGDQFYFCQNDWSQIASEESFMTLLRETSENYGTGLVGKSEETDPLAEEQLSVLFAENVKDVERLCCVIIYEFLSKARLTAKLEKHIGIASVMMELIDSARRIASQPHHIKLKLLQELRKREDQTTTKAKSMKNKKLADLVAKKMSELNGEVRVVQNLKQMAKVKEDQFFGIVSKMLLNQRARIEIGTGLMRGEVTKTSIYLESIYDFNQRLRRYNRIEQFIRSGDEWRRSSVKNDALCATLYENSIPPSVLSSYESTWKALAIIHKNHEVHEIRASISDERQNLTNLNRIFVGINTSITSWNLLKSTYVDGDNPDSMNSLIRSNQLIKDLLKEYPAIRDRQTQEAIDWKRSKVEEMNAFLESLPNFYEVLS